MDSPVDLNIITVSFVIGVLLDWAACVVNSMGNILMRLDSTFKPDPNASCRHFATYSVVCYVMGGIMDVVSLAFIPLSIWACGTSVSIPASALLAKWVLGEVMTVWHWRSSFIIIAGTVAAVLTGCRNNGEHAYQQFMKAWKNPVNVVFALVVIIIEIYCIIRNWEHKQQIEHIKRVAEQNVEANSLINVLSVDNKSPVRLQEFDEQQEYDFDSVIEGTGVESPKSPNSQGMLLSPHALENQSLDQNWWQVIIGALLPAVQTCWTNLLMKCVVELLQAIWFRGQRWEGFAPYLCTLALLISLPLQLLFIKWMMACHECVVIVPVYQCLLIIITSIFGIGFFNERPVSWGGFIISLIISCSGILIMALIPKQPFAHQQTQAHINNLFQKVGMNQT